MSGISFREPVSTLLAPVIATVQPAATLREAANRLAANAIGLLVVVDARGVRGVLSERDIVAAVAEGIDLEEARVRDHATTELVEVTEETSVIDAAVAMSAAEVRHLAVTRAGEVIGVISIRDVLDVVAGQAEVASIG